MREQRSAVGIAQASARTPFAGFALPTSNTTYTPNQFFDVCLPHCSRGCVRLVSLMIRKTLGWCDEHGRPQQEHIRLSYADFEASGISRATVKPAVAEALKRRFIRCIREPAPKAAGRTSVSALYELKWDESGEYIKDATRFRGFFAGDGNRTYIPNQFFDHVVVIEPLAVVKVVGAVVRFSIGFANKWGHRRKLASLSYLDVQRYTKLRDRKSLAAALRVALNNSYIERVEAGYFDPHGGVHSRKATYALKWLKTEVNSQIGMKTPPAKNDVTKSVQKPHRDRFENPTGDRFENPTGLQIKENKILKQQHGAAPSKEEEKRTGASVVDALREEGFDAATAERLASGYPADHILRQIEWLDGRQVRRNRLGMLRVAIEQDWSKPSAEQLRRRNSEKASSPGPLRDARAKLINQFKPFQP